MGQTARDQQRRDRVREYEKALAAARDPVAVLVLFARGREARAAGLALEEAFAATSPARAVTDADGGGRPGDQGAAGRAPAADRRLPAAVWVALRQGDLDATLEALVRASRADFVISVREEIDARYRLTSVPESRALPDVELLQAQTAAFLQIPADVVSIVVGWGPEDPRTAAEVDTLLDQRFGPATGERPVRTAATVATLATAGAEPPRDAAGERPRPPEAVPERRGLLMSESELVAMLALTAEQHAVLRTLTRQADVTVTLR
jgi:hypothetical protein